MRIKYYFIFLLIFPVFSIFAQRDPMFTFFPWELPFYNPGAMGEKEQHLNFVGVFRQGDVLISPEDLEKNTNSQSKTDPLPGDEEKKNTPTKVGQQQILLNIDSYIKQIRGAVSIMFLKDKIGYNDNVGFRFGYATKIPLRGGKLGIGLQFGFLNQKPTSDKYNPNQSDDQTVNLAKESESFLDFDLNFGVHYRAPTWYVGVSGTQIMGGVRISGEKNIFTPVRNLYATGGYIWNLKTPVPWSIEPSLLLQYEFSHISTWSFALMALARYNGILWFGLSYQLDNGIAACFGAVPFYNNTNQYLKGLEIGAAYTFQTKKYSWKNNGSWGDIEILVRYGLNFYNEKPLTGYGSSRHLYKNQY